MPSSSFVVVGSGMSGLVAAVRLLERGHNVQVLEQADRAGGYFGGFENEAGDRFDLAVSHLLGGREGESLHSFLSSAGLDKSRELEPVDIADVMTIQGREIEFPTGLDRLQASLLRDFPESEEDLDVFFGFMRAFMGDAGDARESGRFMMRNYRREFEAFCTATIADPVLRTALAMRIQCDSSSLMIMSGFITECYGKGMVYPHGGVRALVDSIVARIRDMGGKVEFGVKVADLAVRNGTAEGVVVGDGTIRRCDVVLYNGDATKLGEMLEAHGMVGIDAEGRRRGHSSLSIFLTFSGSDLSRFSRAARYYFTETNDVFETYRVLETGALPAHPVVKLHFMSNIDPTLGAADRSLVRIEVDMYHDPDVHDDGFYAQYAEVVESILMKEFLPELATDVVYRRVVTPIDYERLFGHTGGSATGWAHDVDNYMVRRLSQRTSLNNVFITGQWGEYGSGLPQLIASADKSVTLAEQWLRKRKSA